MALVMHGWVRVEQEDAHDHDHPPPLEKNQAQTDLNHWTFKKLARSAVSGFKRSLRTLQRRLQVQQPSPLFYRVCPVMRN